MRLAREKTFQAVEDLHAAKQTLSEEQMARQRDSVQRQLNRVALGRCASLSAVSDQQGHVVTDGPAIAHALRVHWKSTFSRLEIHTRCL